MNNNNNDNNNHVIALLVIRFLKYLHDLCLLYLAEPIHFYGFTYTVLFDIHFLDSRKKKYPTH